MRTILLLSCFVLVSSCAKLVSWDEFQLQQTKYDGNELKTDGYYYELEDNGIHSRGYFFFKNGCLLNMGGGCSSIEEMDDYVRREFVNQNLESKKHKWGIFAIRNNTILFEHYYITDDIRKKSYIKEGIILNDSAFHITSYYRSDGSDRIVVNEMYHFRKFSPKPDSTNYFIK